MICLRTTLHSGPECVDTYEQYILEVTITNLIVDINHPTLPGSTAILIFLSTECHKIMLFNVNTF